jgi:hypothetical protein
MPRRYDAWFESPWGRYAWAVESRLVHAALEGSVGRLVLDVDCGTGRSSALLRSPGVRPRQDRLGRGGFRSGGGRVMCRESGVQRPTERRTLGERGSPGWSGPRDTALYRHRLSSALPAHARRRLPGAPTPTMCLSDW